MAVYPNCHFDLASGEREISYFDDEISPLVVYLFEFQAKKLKA